MRYTERTSIPTKMPANKKITVSAQNTIYFLKFQCLKLYFLLNINYQKV